jgi:hypothetical protein
MNRGYGISGVALAAAACILFARAAHAELAFAGAGAQQRNVVNSNAVPGRGSGQNTVTLMIFSWIQGYMSGFHGFQLLTGFHFLRSRGRVASSAVGIYCVLLSIASA